MYTELRNRGRVGLIAGFVALLLFAVVASSGLLGSAGVGAQPVTTAVGTLPVPNPESIVVVEQDGGQLSLIDAGKATKVADGLVKPNGVGVLADGSTVVADSGNNRLVGIGGRFGNAFKEIAKDIEFPEGVGVGLDGTVYVSLLLKGEVGKVDLQTGKYSTIAKELKGPGQIAVRSGKLYVPQATADPPNVLEIGADGKKTVVASGFEQPIGIVAGPGKSLYVSDFKAGKIIKVDDEGKLTDFATKVAAPVQLASVPFTLVPDAPFTLAVSTKDGVVRFDQTAKKLGTTPAKGATGIATMAVPDPNAPVTTTTTTKPAPVSTSTPRTTITRKPTTSISPGTTLPVIDTTATSSSPALTISLVVVGLLVAAGIIILVVRKPKNMESSGFEERELDADTVVNAFGPCASEEVEMAEAEGARDAIVVQREASEKRVTEAETRTAEARTRLAKASTATKKAESAAQTATALDTPETAPDAEADDESLEITPEKLGLTTDAGRDALTSFASGKIDAKALEERWRELGEQKAIETVRTIGEKRAMRNAAKPASDLDKANAAEAAAKADVDEAEKDRTDALAEIERLNEREVEAEQRIAGARKRLDACHSKHAAEQVAKEAKAKEAAEAAEATAAKAQADAVAKAKARVESDSADGDAKPGDAKPGDAKPGDAKPADAKPADAKPGDVKKADTKSSDEKAPTAPPVPKPDETKLDVSKPDTPRLGSKPANEAPDGGKDTPTDKA